MRMRCDAPRRGAALRMRHVRLTLQVASTGDVVYALPEDFQATLRARSWWLRAQPALQQVPHPPYASTSFRLALLPA